MAVEKITQPVSQVNLINKVNEIIDQSIVVDDTLSSTSENPVQNKIIYKALTTKANATDIPTKTSQLTNDSGFIQTINVNGTAQTTTSSTVDITIPESPTVGAGKTTIQRNGTAIGTIDANATTNSAINISVPTVPTVVSAFTNDAGYISGISSSDVTTALGYTPYNSTNPSGYQANVLETVKVNGTALTNTSKTVDIIVPAAAANGNMVIQRNGAAVGTFTANQSSASTINITVPTTAADVGALPDSTTIGSAYLTIKKNGTAIGSFSANATTGVNIDVTVPTKTSDLTNDDGFISSISSSDVTTALGYTPYNNTNPDGFQANIIETVKVNGTALTPTTKTVDITVPAAPTVGSANLTIQKNGSGIATFSANSTVAVTADISVPTTITELASTTQMAAINSGVNTTVVSQVTTNKNNIAAIQTVIPSAATASNQLADKSFVNSSIATNTAYFIGTFDSVESLEAYTGTVTTNDYAFVETTDTAGNTFYDRYKYNGSEWLFEYELNNSSFTSDQWAAINSGVTTTIVSQVTTNKNDITTIKNTMSGYGNIVTHSVAEFATAAQGSLADSALQSGDSNTLLTNDAGYITSISSSDVTTALGYTPYSNANPNGYQANVIETVKVNGTIQTVTSKTVDLTVAAAGNGNMVIQRNGSAVGTFTANQSSASTINITVPTTASDVGALPDSTTIGDGNLVIQRNSTVLGTFKANATAAKTINISVPTTASDVGALPDSTVIGDGDITIQRNGVAVGTINANQSSVSTINITVPTTASDIGALPDSTTIGDGKVVFKKNGTAFATASANQTSTINVDYTVPTAVSDLSDASNYQTTANLITVMSTESTDTTYPSAKCVNDALDGKVSKTGDTISGNLEVTSGLLCLEGIGSQVSASTSRLVLGTPTNQYSYLTGNNVGAFGIYTGEGATRKGVACYPGKNFFMDAATNSSTLGRTNNVWSTTYTNNLANASNSISTADIITGIGKANTALQPNNSNTLLTNDAGYITSISSSDVTTALGYTPYNDSNPSGYQANIIETVKVNGTALTPATKTVDITIPAQQTVNNANMVIKRNGTAIGTFTANQSSASTINISVPTTASDVGALPDSTPIPVITDTYSATSTDGMSGKAVASAVSGFIKLTNLSATAPITYNNSTGVISANIDSTVGTNTNYLVSSGAVKTYVDNAIVGGVKYQGTWTATSQTNYSSITLPVKKGYMYYVEGSATITAGGTTIEWNAGDFLIVNADVASGGTLTNVSKIDNTESTDIVRLNATQTLTNKTLSADSNSITDLTTSNLKSGVLATSVRATASASDTVIVTEKGIAKALAGKANSGDIPTVNNANMVIQRNGSAVGTFTANQSAASTINISVPTNTSDLTNGAGFITGISSSDVTTALGYTPYNNSNPSGYQANVIETVKVNGTALSPTTKTVDITIPAVQTVNDSNMVIQRNGTAVGTFTANQSSASTINITVPTTAADVGALPSNTTIGNANYTIKQNGTAIGTFNANGTTNGSVDITVPTVDTVISNSSTNPVQNKVVYSAIASKTSATFSVFGSGTSTGVSVLPITQLTQAQYATITPSATELYITDEALSSSDISLALGYVPYSSNNPSGYQANVIETVKVNGTALTPSTKTVNITVPTNTSELTNGAGFITNSAISNMQTTGNLVTVVSSASTNAQYPSAKLFYDTVGNIEAALNSIIAG